MIRRFLPEATKKSAVILAATCTLIMSGCGSPSSSSSSLNAEASVSASPSPSSAPTRTLNPSPSGTPIQSGQPNEAGVCSGNLVDPVQHQLVGISESYSASSVPSHWVDCERAAAIAEKFYGFEAEHVKDQYYGDYNSYDNMYYHISEIDGFSCRRSRGTNLAPSYVKGQVASYVLCDSAKENPGTVTTITFNPAPLVPGMVRAGTYDDLRTDLKATSSTSASSSSGSGKQVFAYGPRNLGAAASDKCVFTVNRSGEFSTVQCQFRAKEKPANWDHAEPPYYRAMIKPDGQIQVIPLDETTDQKFVEDSGAEPLTLNREAYVNGAACARISNDAMKCVSEQTNHGFTISPNGVETF